MLLNITHTNAHSTLPMNPCVFMMTKTTMMTKISNDVPDQFDDLDDAAWGNITGEPMGVL
jgi:hypothetical protein